VDAPEKIWLWWQLRRFVSISVNLWRRVARLRCC
jgi:hypothetical protein